MEHTNLRARLHATLVSFALVAVVAAPAAAGTITLGWDANSEPWVVGYKLHVGTQPGWYTQHIDVGLSTNYSWGGAADGQLYCFAVSAYIAGYLEGPYSSEVCGYSNAAPTLANPGDRVATQGQATSLQLQGSDPQGQPLTYSASGLPPGLTIMASTGFISGTPTTVGTYNVTATASDGQMSASQSFTWTITSSVSGGGGGAGSPGAGGTGLRGEYFSGTAFASLITTRTDATVNFTWGVGAPASNVGTDDFSVRWTGEVYAPATGTYTFSTVSDDGVRLWVGSQLLIDNWTDHGATTDNGSVVLQAGQKYPVKLEYYEAGGAATIQLRWTYPGQSAQVIPQSMLFPSGSGSGSWSGGESGGGSGVTSGLSGEYWNGLFGSYVTTRTDATVNFTWGYGSPGGNVGADNFSVRWTGEVTTPVTGWYQFSTFSDDGVRLWVGNQLLIDNWTDHGPTTDTSGAVWLNEGQRYAIRLEYYEGGVWSTIQLQWAYPGQSTQVIPQAMLSSSGSGGGSGISGGSGLRGSYYSGLYAAFLEARVEAVDFNWGGGAPASNVPADNFSVEWNGRIVAPVTGTYYFSTVSDDGVRLLLGNQLVIDNWTNHGPTTDTGSAIWLEAGQSYPIRLNYYENSGGAVIQLQWSYPGQSTEVVPQSALMPD